MEDNIIYKFKVGDIVTGTKEVQWIYARKSEITKAYKNKFGRNSYNIVGSVSEWYEDELKLVENKEGIKLEKTFREVIADIKEGEVWESRILKIFIEYGCVKIHFNDENIRIKDDDIGIRINEKDKFKLQRKQYTFTEAFKAYEEGKEIESCEVLTGCYPSKYKRIENEDAQWREGSYSWDKRKYIGIPFYEVRGKWYINN